VSKILRFLQTTKSGHYWEDKWHISPYYTTAHAIIACTGYANETVSDTVDWLINRQKADGSWGLFGATSEETAYVLQALWLWDQKVQHIPEGCLHKGKIWLEDHQENKYNPLWIGKCLYSPRLVIDSAIITALSLIN
jgi:halimadienyl-diphosphate synthase